ncbi:MAG: hypothetical protein KDD40_10535 [Bdellovibrionales bacterium]|nr:hypothetical protein [Bdellovibrionales bacterium]
MGTTHWTLVLHAIMIFIIGCAKMNSTANKQSTSLSTEDSIVYPFTKFTLSDNDENNHQFVFGSTAESRSDYGYDELNSNLRGHFLFDKKRRTLVFERSVVSGDLWADHTIYPPQNELLYHKLGELQTISIKIKAQINKSNPLIPTGCGLALGFGESAGHFNAVKSPISLRLFDRDWLHSFNADKTPRDYIRFVYEPYANDEKLTIDAPINSYNALKQWDNFTASRFTEAANEFNVITGPELVSEGDYIVYEQKIEFDHDTAQVSVQIKPLDSNLDMTFWQTQKVTWDTTKPSTEVNESGDPRGGLNLSSVKGQTPLTWHELKSAHLYVGFVANLAPRLCEFSELKIELDKP